MLSDEDRAWREFRDAVNAGIEAENAAAEAERFEQEARLHEEWLAARRAAAAHAAEAEHRVPPDETGRFPPVTGDQPSVLAEPESLRTVMKAAVGLWVIHQISGWPWASRRSC